MEAEELRLVFHQGGRNRLHRRQRRGEPGGCSGVHVLIRAAGEAAEFHTLAQTV